MRTALIGIGQAGGKLAQALAEYDRRLGFDAIESALAVNTAEADLKPLDIDTLLVGQDRVQGHGVGGDNELAAEILQDDVTEVMDSLDARVTARTDAIVVVAALGGGTGSGGAPAVASRLQRIYDRPIYGIGILPGDDEGELYHVNAGRSLKTFVGEVDSLLLVDNDAWWSSEESVGEAFAELNERIARRIVLLLSAGEAVEGVGQSVVDASEVINTLREGGLSAIGYASAPASEASSENVTTITSLTRKALLSGMSVPDVTDAESALLVIAGRPEAISRKGVERARRWLEEETGSLQVRGGDFPIDDDSLAALVLLGGIERSDRIEAIMDHAREAEKATTETTRDDAEAFSVDELDDVF